MRRRPFGRVSGNMPAVLCGMYDRPLGRWPSGRTSVRNDKFAGMGVVQLAVDFYGVVVFVHALPDK